MSGQTGPWPHAMGFSTPCIRRIIYEQVPVNRQLRWHRQIGARLEAAYGPSGARAGRRTGRAFSSADGTSERAVQYLQYAGEEARNGAVRIRKPSAILLTALALLAALPETPERAQQELTLQLARGPALAIMRGDATPEVEQVYLRAQTLCQQLGESAESLLVLHGLWTIYNAQPADPAGA